jgi:hypothetical protein
MMTGTMAGMVAALVMVVWMPAGAQAQAAQENEVALVGCVELERDYRARKEAGRGGVLGTGVGVGNEFVLSTAKPAPARVRAAQAAPAGDYEITGRLEKDFLRHVGRQVEVVGTIEKNADGIDRINVTLWHPVGDYCPGAK